MPVPTACASSDFLPSDVNDASTSTRWRLKLDLRPTGHPLSPNPSTAHRPVGQQMPVASFTRCLTPTSQMNRLTQVPHPTGRRMKALHEAAMLGVGVASG
ncbi:hypothetical protein VaNZ11_002212 [Volvox africanus]|uniref:Uncharacterized protein n=1 Tax=Volvox africanus TaxID=51714 RepID=A0ABQ5RRG5_9CHLO|nr:hypothetical protein VaNZ11_002212 [Volvox africanus]